MSDYHVEQFNGSFSQTNRYKDPPSLSPPSKEVDAAWKVFQEGRRRFTRKIRVSLTYIGVGTIRISREDIEKLGKDPDTAVQYPQEYGGGYMGYVESIHMVHCLDLIRKMTWQDQYANDSYFGDEPLMIRAHTGKPGLS